MPDWRATRLKRQVLSKNRLTEESPQVDLRSSDQKHWLFGSYGLALAGPTGDLVCDRQAGPSRTAPQARRVTPLDESKPPESRRMCAWAAWSDRRSREGNEPCRSRRAPAPRRSRGNGGSGEPSRAAATPPLDECRVRRIERAVLPPASWRFPRTVLPRMIRCSHLVH